MPTTRDPAAIRAILQTDPRWAVYLLGDLAPALFAQSVWACTADAPPALVLLFRGFDPPVLAVVGPAERARGLLDETGHDGDVVLNVRPDLLPVLRADYDLTRLDAMWRMTLVPADYRPAAVDGVARLGREDLPALQRLYADGEAAGEAPHFFLPSMVDDGYFHGMREGPELIAVAGTHLVVPQEGVAAIGCVYTRRDRRGRGLAARLTSAVVNELLRLRLAVIALNVRRDNAAAVRVYERLGFVRYCDYYEGRATRRPGPPATSPRRDGFS